MSPPHESKPLERERKKKMVNEKKRRDRMNELLQELKTLLLEAHETHFNMTQSKWEKADILEMTVLYLKHLLTSPTSTAATSPAFNGHPPHTPPDSGKRPPFLPQLNAFSMPIGMPYLGGIPYVPIFPPYPWPL